MNNFSDDVLREHYKRFAVEQGHSTCFYDRRECLHEFLQKEINNRTLKALEIGCGGFPFLRGESVKYFETLSTNELKEQYIKIRRTTDYFPKEFDFVSPTGDLSVINETFDIVFSSHVIEHCPDLVEHFHGVSKILNKGGVYILVVPDKRYCFDYYNSESTIMEVIDAFANERKIPRLADLISSTYTCTHNDAVLHWLGEHGKPFSCRDISRDNDAKLMFIGEYFFDDYKGSFQEKILHLIDKYAEAIELNKYISAHNWRLTPDNFRYILDVLNELHFIDLKIFRLCHTIWGRQEFTAMLEKI